MRKFSEMRRGGRASFPSNRGTLRVIQVVGSRFRAPRQSTHFRHTARRQRPLDTVDCHPSPKPHEMAMTTSVSRASRIRLSAFDQLVRAGCAKRQILAIDQMPIQDPAIHVVIRTSTRDRLSRESQNNTTRSKVTLHAPKCFASPLDMQDLAAANKKPEDVPATSDPLSRLVCKQCQSHGIGCSKMKIGKQQIRLTRTKRRTDAQPCRQSQLGGKDIMGENPRAQRSRPKLNCSGETDDMPRNNLALINSPKTPDPKYVFYSFLLLPYIQKDKDAKIHPQRLQTKTRENHASPPFATSDSVFSPTCILNTDVLFGDSETDIQMRRSRA